MNHKLTIEDHEDYEVHLDEDPDYAPYNRDHFTTRWDIFDEMEIRAPESE